MGMHKLVLGPSTPPSDKNCVSLTDSEMETGGEVIPNPTRPWNRSLSAQLLPPDVIHSWKSMKSLNLAFSLTENSTYNINIV